MLERGIAIKMHPNGFRRDDNRLPRHQQFILPYGVDAQQRQAKPVVTRPHFTDIMAIGG